MPRVLLSQGPRLRPFFLFRTKPQHCCIMNAAVTNMAVMFGAMQVAKRIPFDENPEYVRYAQLVYVTSQLLCLAVFYYCSIQVRRSCTAHPQIKRKNDLTVLKYVNAKNPMVRCFFLTMQSQDPGELVTTTHRDYDLSEISKSMRGILMGSLMVGLMHLYFGYTNPYVCGPLTHVQSRDPEHSSSEKCHGIQHGQDLDLGYARHG